MPFPMTTEPRSPNAIDDATFSRRGLGKRLLLGASALAVLLASKHDTVQAAPTTPWVLGGNSGVLTNGSEFLGTKNVAPLIFKTAATNNVPTERMRITPAGNVGIGTSAPSARLMVLTSTGIGIFGRHNYTAGAEPGVQGETNSTSAGAAGVMGVVRSTAPGADSAAVRGTNNGTSYNGAGVRGTHAGGGYGVHGSSVNGSGVYGSGGVWGVLANTSRSDGYGGVFANYSGNNTSTTGVGVVGLGSGGTDDLIHPGGAFYDAGGEFSGPSGVIGAAAHASGTGVIALQGPGDYALYASGDVYISGTLGLGGTKNFEIDHPLDPANKILRHAAVESSEVKNTYDGTVTLQNDGTATVTLPAWMEALNKDFHYQLTTIGGFAPVYIAEKIKDNRFKIAGGKAGMEVCWQVIGTRNDTYMQQHPFEVESDKQGADHGKYLAPEAFGKTADKGVGQQGYKRAPRQAAPAPPRGPQAGAPND